MLLTQTGWIFETVNIFWLVIIIATIALDIITVDLTSIWFAIGAVIALVLSLLGVHIYIQIGVFLVVATSLLATVGQWTKKMMRGKHATNLDASIGRDIIVTKDVDPIRGGEGKYQGLIWTVMNDNVNEEIHAGDVAIIVRVEGNKLIIERK